MINLPSSVLKKIGTNDDGTQWFSQLWFLVNANKINITDEIVQEIFVAKGKGREAQIEFYNKYGVEKEERVREQEIKVVSAECDANNRECSQVKLENNSIKETDLDRKMAARGLLKTVVKKDLDVLTKFLVVVMFIFMGLFVLAVGRGPLMTFSIMIGLGATIKGSFKTIGIKNRKTAAIVLVATILLAVFFGI